MLLGLGNVPAPSGVHVVSNCQRAGSRATAGLAVIWPATVPDDGSIRVDKWEAYSDSALFRATANICFLPSSLSLLTCRQMKLAPKRPFKMALFELTDCCARQVFFGFIYNLTRASAEIIEPGQVFVRESQRYSVDISRNARCSRHTGDPTEIKYSHC